MTQITRITAAASPIDSQWDVIRLQRYGTSPLCFEGRVISCYTGRLPSIKRWYNLALYRKIAGGYAVAISFVAAIVTERAQYLTRYRAMNAESLDAAVELFETYDASQDLCPGLSAPTIAFDDLTISPAQVTLQAATLHLICQDVVRSYRASVGRFLADLGFEDV